MSKLHWTSIISPQSDGHVQESKKQQMLEKMWRKCGTLYTVGWNETSEDTIDTIMEFSQKNKIGLPYDMAFIFVGMFLMESK